MNQNWKLSLILKIFKKNQKSKSKSKPRSFNSLNFLNAKNRRFFDFKIFFKNQKPEVINKNQISAHWS
jgi:hypothetical protein